MLAVVTYFFLKFDKNKHYFMPIYTPSPNYFYKEWNEENAIMITYKNDNNDNANDNNDNANDNNINGKTITLHGYSSTPIKKILSSDIIILYFHGNAGNVYLRIPQFKEMVEKLNARYEYGNKGTTVREHVIIAFDYQGFGLSSGVPTSQGILEDGMQIWRWCQSKFKQNKIILYGESIGTSVSAYVYLNSIPDGIILKSPFSSMHSLISDWFHLPGFMRNIPRWFIPNDFLTGIWLEKRIQSRCIWEKEDKNIPIVILHNKEDKLIPTRNIKELLHKYRSFALEGGHNDCDIDIAWLNGCSYVLDKV